MQPVPLVKENLKEEKIAAAIFKITTLMYVYKIDCQIEMANLLYNIYL
jgi:hypothetical protein